MIWKNDFLKLPRIRKRMIPGHGYVEVPILPPIPDTPQEKERKEKLKKKIQISLRKNKIRKLNGI